MDKVRRKGISFNLAWRLRVCLWMIINAISINAGHKTKRKDQFGAEPRPEWIPKSPAVDTWTNRLTSTPLLASSSASFCLIYINSHS